MLYENQTNSIEEQDNQPSLSYLVCRIAAYV
jgi:hypothetical protein